MCYKRVNEFCFDVSVLQILIESMVDCCRYGFELSLMFLTYVS